MTLKTGVMAAEYIFNLLKYTKIVVKVIFTIVLFLLELFNQINAAFVNISEQIISKTWQKNLLTPNI